MNNAFNIVETHKFSDEPKSSEPPPPCDSSNFGDIKERTRRLNHLRKNRGRMSLRNTLVTGLTAMICLLPMVTYAQTEAGKLLIADCRLGMV